MEKLLHDLIDAYRVSGHEEDVRNIVVSKLNTLGYRTETDNMGNVIAKAGSGSKKVMLTTHMDSAGLMVTYIDDKGFLRVGAVGSLKLSNFVPGLVRFNNGLKGILYSSGKNDEVESLFIDAGFKSREEALGSVREGDTASFVSEVCEKDELVFGYGVGSAAACYSLLTLAERVKASEGEVKDEVYFVFSTQGKLDGRGARAAAFEIEPEICITVNNEASGDFIDGKGNIKLNNGPVVPLMSRGLVIHQDVKASIDAAQKASNITVQYVVSDEQTEGGPIHKEGYGVKAGVVSIPCRYLGSLHEVVSKSDIESVSKLLESIIK